MSRMIFKGGCGKLRKMNDPMFPNPFQFETKTTPLLGSYFYNELVKSIDQANLFILSVQYQWKWNIHERFSKVQMLGNAIIRARKRNLNISIILNQESPGRHINKINSVTCNQLSKENISVKMIRTPSLLHTKLWIIDGIYSFIGSHNISARSLSVNEEVSVKIESQYFASFMKQYFENLWGSR